MGKRKTRFFEDTLKYGAESLPTAYRKILEIGQKTSLSSAQTARPQPRTCPIKR